SFVSSARPPRPLHSFPTRRSSDLLVFTRAPLLPPAPADLPRVWCVAAGYDDEGEAARWGAHPNHKPFAVLEPLVRQWSLPGNLVDRKSTRLNSSHRTISYAVFCLK